MSIFAKELALAPVGLCSRPPEPGPLEPKFGGRLLTQSCTRRLTLGFCSKLSVFFEEGLEVIIIVGPEGSWEEVSEVGVSVALVGLERLSSGGRVEGGR